MAKKRLGREQIIERAVRAIVEAKTDNRSTEGFLTILRHCQKGLSERSSHFVLTAVVALGYSEQIALKVHELMLHDRQRN